MIIQIFFLFTDTSTRHRYTKEELIRFNNNRNCQHISNLLKSIDLYNNEDIQWKTECKPIDSTTPSEPIIQHKYFTITPKSHGNILIETRYKFKFDVSKDLETQLKSIIRTEMLLEVVQPCGNCPANYHPGK